MRKACHATGIAAVTLASAAAAAAPSSYPQGATFTTVITASLQTEGLTGDDRGNLYTAARNPGVGLPCAVWRVSRAAPSLVVVGWVPPVSDTAQCVTGGLALDEAGDVYVAADGRVMRFTPNETNPPTATTFATGVAGANGIAFDRAGNLWISDGVTNQGRIFRVPPSGGAGVVQFRIQPMRNSTAWGGVIAGDGVGRQVRSFPPGTVTNTLGAANEIVANGVAFDPAGDIIIADSSRGALWKAELDADGNLLSPTGCDPTFAADTLCMSNIVVAHPWLENVDGIALDSAGNVWAASNARQAIVLVTRDGRVYEVFRNPVNASGRRNSGTAAVGDNHILEFPASPYLLDSRFCTSSFDQDIRDNSPNTAGELNAVAGPLRGKISCMDQALMIPGLRLPVR